MAEDTVVFENFKSEKYNKLAEQCSAAAEVGDKPKVAELMAAKKAEHARCVDAYIKAKHAKRAGLPFHKAMVKERARIRESMAAQAASPLV
jgi:septal ring factor EnvC (AmiA/AmiB activator)